MSGAGARELADIHSHMIPGVDDGTRDVEEALDALRTMSSAGIGTVVTTPHLPGSVTLEPSTLERRLADVDAAWDELRQSAEGELPELVLHRGHEIALDVPQPDLSDERLRLAGTRYVLVEWPRFQIPPGTVGAVEGLVGGGYRPIIAHPERYVGISGDLEAARRWRSAGARLQVNHGSLAGKYGSGVRRNAVRLLAEGWVDYLSTDFHGHPGSSPHVEASMELFGEHGAEEAWRILSGTNPARASRGEEPLPVPPLRFREGVWAKLMGFFDGA